MQITKTLPAALTLAMMTTPVFAAGVDQGESYVGGGISQLEVQTDNTSSDFEPTGVIGRLGYGVVDNVAVEGRLGFGLTDDSQDVSGTDIDLDLDSLGGIYGVGYVPLNHAVSVYALAGLTAVGFEASDSASSLTYDDTDFSYGVGLEGDFNERFSGYVEYVDYVDGNDNNVDFEVSGVTVGLNYNY